MKSAILSLLHIISVHDSTTQIAYGNSLAVAATLQYQHSPLQRFWLHKFVTQKPKYILNQVSHNTTNKIYYFSVLKLQIVHVLGVTFF